MQDQPTVPADGTPAANRAAALGRQIAALRRSRGLSQVELANLLSRSESWVSQVERGARHIDRLSVLQLLADAFGVSLANLLAPADSAECPSAEEVA